MPEKRAPRPPVVLRATITLDGKLEGTPLQTVHDAQANALSPDQARALLVAGGVDEIHLTIRQQIDGRRDSPTLSGSPAREFFTRSVALRLLRMETRAGDCLLQYRVLRRSRKPARPA